MSLKEEILHSDEASLDAYMDSRVRVGFVSLKSCRRHAKVSPDLALSYRSFSMILSGIAVLSCLIFLGQLIGIARKRSSRGGVLDTTARSSFLSRQVGTVGGPTIFVFRLVQLLSVLGLIAISIVQPPLPAKEPTSTYTQLLPSPRAVYLGEWTVYVSSAPLRVSDRTCLIVHASPTSCFFPSLP